LTEVRVGERPATVLVVDDDEGVARVLAALLRQDGLEALTAASGSAALDLLRARPCDLVISDLRMPGMDGLQLLAALGQRLPDVPVIVITAHGTIPLAVGAMRGGAADFILKPFDREEILYAVRKALAAAPRPAAAPLPGGLGGDAPELREVLRLIEKAAPSEASVLLRGESGTGKDLAARALHERSRRRSGPFVKVHCAALPEALLESELFGYEKGAFTGAASRKPGRVELAQDGTLFLDEIGDVPLAVQVKLLRLLQDRAYERLGGVESLTANVRFVAATHRDLEAMVAAGQFREDLFYRLSVVPIRMPALRERPADIASLAHRFTAAFGDANGKPGATLASAAVERLAAQPWPGNVRQLQNFIERLIVFSDDPALTLADVDRELSRGAAARPGLEPLAATLDGRRREAERDALQDALTRAGGNRTQAARLLGVSRRTLYNKLEEHGLA
jgi:DNA-binding NtrC family response regulator